MNKSTSAAAWQSAALFFAGWNETMIWSALQDRMGDLWLDEETSPTCAVVVNGDFAFFAGDSGGRCGMESRSAAHPPTLRMMAGSSCKWRPCRSTGGRDWPGPAPPD